MATHVLRREDRYPVGTSVAAYLKSNWLQHELPPTGDPKGAAAATATVQADGSVTFTGLADSTNYFAHADISGDDRYVSFRTTVASGVAVIRSDRKRALWKATAAIDETIPRIGAAMSAQTVLTSGTLRLNGGLVLQPGDVVTSITVMAASTAAVTPTAQWFCLVRQSDLAVLAKTTDDTTTAWAASVPKTLNLSASYPVIAETPVYVGVVVVAATVPTLLGASLGSSNAAVAGAPSVAGNSTTGLTNPASLGATAGAITLAGVVFYATVQ